MWRKIWEPVSRWGARACLIESRMKTRLSKDGTKVVATYELHPFDFDRSDHLKLWTLADLIDINQLALLWGDLAQLRIPGFMKTVNRFARYGELQIQPAFYSKLCPGGTVTVGVGITHVGRSSWVVEGDVRLAGTGEVLCKSLFQGVLVDMATRKPIPIPDNLGASFPKKVPLPRLDLPTPTKPGKMYRHDFVICSSDLDLNEHTNAYKYIRFCMDTVAASIRKGNLAFFKKDLSDLRVKKMSLLFQNETREGDNVTVECTEDFARPYCLDFQIKRGDDAIMKTCFEFFDDEIKAKL